MDVIGYEVRTRAVGEKSAGTPDAERSMFSMLSDTRLDQIVGSHSCFINVTPEALAEGLWKKIPADKIVLCYLNDFAPEDAVAQELLKLARSGSRVVLSGQLNPQSLELFADRAPVLKLDVTSIAPEDLEKKFAELRRYKVPLLAGSVDTYDDLEFCQSLGFDLYEGRFIARSASHEEKQIPVNRLTMMRARMCELLSESLKNAQKDAFFSAGLLSVIDALLDCPMEKAVAHLPLVDEVKSALIDRSGPVGQALRCAIAYENADWDNVQFYGMAPAPIREAYMESIAWARQLSSGL